MSLEKTIITSRLEVRAPCESDRTRFVELFLSDDFMVFSGRARSVVAAHARFDHMHAMCEVIGFAKQPIIERASGIIVGYTGVDHFTLEGEPRRSGAIDWYPSREDWATRPRQATLCLLAPVRRIRANYWP